MVFRIYHEKDKLILECCQCGEKALLRGTSGLDLEAHACLVAETTGGGTHKEND